MSDRLVDELRLHARSADYAILLSGAPFTEAADEIERLQSEIEYLRMMMLAIADQLEDGFPMTAQMLAIEFMGPDNRAKSDPHNFNNRPRLGLD